MSRKEAPSRTVDRTSSTPARPITTAARPMSSTPARPMSSTPARPITTPVRPNSTPAVRYSVLVVDDDEALLQTTVALLEPYHDVTSTTSAFRALELLGSKSFHVVVSDWMMPDLDGIEFFQRVSRLDCAVACLLMSAQMEELPATIGWEERKLFLTLAKPFSPDQMLARIDNLGRHAAVQQSIRKIRSRS